MIMRRPSLTPRNTGTARADEDDVTDAWRAPAPTPRAVQVASAHASHVGHARASNQDVVVDEPGDAVFGVLDGMGGTSAGGVAAELASASILDVVRQCRGAPGEATAMLRASLRRASSIVRRAAAGNPAWLGMGTTAVLCAVRDPGVAHVAHVGDSRAYLARGGALRLLTKDHSMLQALIDRSGIERAAARRHPLGNVLLRSLGGRPDVEVDHAAVPMRVGDRILLCSDGLTGYAEEDTIARVLGSIRAPDQIVGELVALALDGGGGDNVSVVVVERTS